MSAVADVMYTKKFVFVGDLLTESEFVILCLLNTLAVKHSPMIVHIPILTVPLLLKHFAFPLP